MIETIALRRALESEAGYEFPTARARRPAVHAQPVESRVGRGLAVEVRGASKSFGDRPVLRDLDLEIGAGEFVAVIGRSGCGKSTLLRLVAGLDRTTGGEIAIDGRTVDALQPDVRFSSRMRGFSPGSGSSTMSALPGNGGGARPPSPRSRMSASPIAPVTGRPSSRADSGSASRSRGRWSVTRASSSSTSRSGRSMR